MPDRMLTRWSPEYVRTFFRSDRADEPLPAVFKTPEGCQGFVDNVRVRLPGVRITLVPGHEALVLEGATEENLMDVIGLAEFFLGRVLFPGALPACEHMAVESDPDPSQPIVIVSRAPGETGGAS